jgi:hypothetical protein
MKNALLPRPFIGIERHFLADHDDSVDGASLQVDNDLDRNAVGDLDSIVDINLLALREFILSHH